LVSIDLGHNEPAIRSFRLGITSLALKFVEIIQSISPLLLLGSGEYRTSALLKYRVNRSLEIYLRYGGKDGGAERDRTADLLVAKPGYGIRWRNTRRHRMSVCPRRYRGFRSSERY
jgi:hypothetical protein